ELAVAIPLEADGLKRLAIIDQLAADHRRPTILCDQRHDHIAVVELEARSHVVDVQLLRDFPLRSGTLALPIVPGRTQLPVEDELVALREGKLVVEDFQNERRGTAGVANRIRT